MYQVRCDSLLVVISIALSFVVATPLINRDDKIYNRYRPLSEKYQREERLYDDQLMDTGSATIAIFGLGRVGAGAYHKRYTYLAHNFVTKIDVCPTKSVLFEFVCCGRILISVQRKP